MPERKYRIGCERRDRYEVASTSARFRGRGAPSTSSGQALGTAGKCGGATWWRPSLTGASSRCY